MLIKTIFLSLFTTLLCTHFTTASINICKNLNDASVSHSSSPLRCAVNFLSSFLVILQCPVLHHCSLSRMEKLRFSPQSWEAPKTSDDKYVTKGTLIVAYVFSAARTYRTVTFCNFATCLPYLLVRICQYLLLKHFPRGQKC